MTVVTPALAVLFGRTQLRDGGCRNHKKASRFPVWPDAVLRVGEPMKQVLARNVASF